MRFVLGLYGLGGKTYKDSKREFDAQYPGLVSIDQFTTRVDSEKRQQLQLQHVSRQQEGTQDTGAASEMVLVAAPGPSSTTSMAI